MALTKQAKGKLLKEEFMARLCEALFKAQMEVICTNDYGTITIPLQVNGEGCYMIFKVVFTNPYNEEKEKGIGFDILDVELVYFDRDKDNLEKPKSKIRIRRRKKNREERQ